MAAETICMVSLQKSKIFTSDVWLKKIFFPADRLITLDGPSVRYFRFDTWRQPLYMYRYSVCGNTDELQRLHLLDCMECGCCAFTCPGKLPLVEQFRKGKGMLRAAMAEAKAKEEKK